MNIVDRVKRILMSPTTEWPVIAAETTPTQTLITGYVLPLAAISAAASFIGQSLIGTTLFGTTYRTPIGTGLGMAVWAVIMAVVGVFVCAYIINAFAPTFGAAKSDTQALKVAAYSFTPVWVLGVLQILPVLGVLAILGAFYAAYLMYLGLRILMQAPEDKVIGYTAVVILVVIVVMFVLGAIGGMMFAAAAVGPRY